MHPRRGRARPASGRHGITLIESAISIVLVGVVLVGALQTVGSARKGQRIMADRARGQQLALDLMNEILTQDYSAVGESRVFGLEPGKSDANRSQFTDVDDYNGWTESPPADRSGNPLIGASDWTRSVTVVWADPTTWAPTPQSDTGLKLITVTAASKGAQAASVSAYRTAAWVDTVPASSDALRNYAPTAAAVASPTSDQGKLATRLDAGASSDRDGDELSYVWDFGDGSRGTGIAVDHTYEVVGTYTATLTVYDGRGGVATASVVLTVTP